MYYAIYNKLHADLTTYINYILIIMYNILYFNMPYYNVLL